MRHIWEAADVHTGFQYGNPRERKRNHSEDLDVDGRIILYGSSSSGMERRGLD
jgi:hypothetical protein